MEILRFLALCSIGVFFFTLGVNHASAAEITYEPNGFVLLDVPNVCSLTPKDPSLTQTQIEKLLEQTRLSVDEWKVQLMNEASKQNWDNWNINYKNIDSSSKSSEFVNCDILIYFTPIPGNPEENFGNLGITLGNENLGKSFIEIHYLEPSECESTERKGDIIYVYNYPCYQGMMVSSELGAIIRHEIGHALGLGHYASENPELSYTWAIGSSPSPSIMVEMMYENVREVQIKPKDIDLLQSIYGTDGFILNPEEKKSLSPELSYFTEEKFKKFTNNEFGFSIDIPKDWYTYDELIEDENYSQIVAFVKDDDLLVPSISINFVNNEHGISGKNNDETIENLKKSQQEWCSSIQKDDDGYECKFFEILDSKISTINGQKSYHVTYSWSDGNYMMLTEVIQIQDNKNNWEIITEDILGPKFLRQKTFEKSINSFMIESITNQSDDALPEILSEEKLNSSEFTKIPNWIRGNAGWWAQGAIGDSDFVAGIQYLIKEKIMEIPETAKAQNNTNSNEIPSWIKNNANWWAQGLITDGDFVKGIQYLVEQGIIEV